LTPRTPQLNSVAERRNKTLLDMVRSMMCRATLPISLWGYALETAAHILNLVPTKKGSQRHLLRCGRENVLLLGTSKSGVVRPKDNVVFVARRGTFLEREMISKEDSRSKIDLEEIQESTDEEPIVNTNTQQEVVTPV
ncbi:retrotransposon protein, putative, ty1-copia subclass, partial [Tanacetum coccineum]